MASGSWRNLELRVAQYFERNGYAARTNQKEKGRSGLIHEIDVLAEKRDAAGTHRVVVECKAWRSPVEKDVVYKLANVMQDAGLSKGIIVSVGGLRTGARVAAEQAHIDLWGPEEIRYHLGDEALAGLPLPTPDAALGVEIAVEPGAAGREMRKARGGFAGIGADEIASIDLVWVPSFEFQLAITRIRPGLISDKEEVVRRWALFEALTGRLIGARDEPRTFTEISLGAPVVRQQRAPAQVIAEVRKVVAKHRNAKTDAAQKARLTAFDEVGLPGSTREFAIEAEKQVYVPFYIGTLRRRTGERLVAIHAGTAMRVDSVEKALHDKIDILRQALDEAASQGAERTAHPPTELVHEAIGSLAHPSDVARMCKCGEAMVLRHRKADGAPFWGCSTFPRCRNTEPA